MYTLLGSWVLLAVPGMAALTRHEPSTAEITADRQAGIAPSPVIYCTGCGSRELAEVIDVLGCDAADRWRGTYSKMILRRLETAAAQHRSRAS